jgi:hypothetical protein
MNPTYEEVKNLVQRLLGHDRWNSGLSDERLAEKIAVTLDGRGVLSPPRPVQAGGS